MISSREVRLANRPDGLPQMSDFAFATVDLAEPEAGQVIVKNAFLSVDPYMRARMNDRKGYHIPFELDQPMLGSAVGTVVKTNSPSLSPGDWVVSMLGWREYAKGPAESFQRIDTSMGEPRMFLNVLGTPGLTAYVGLTLIAGLTPGETVFISSAAGAVGSIACQLAKSKGCYVIGSAGSAEKCQWLVEVAGIDTAIDYRSDTLLADLQTAAPSGIDIYFDNVGGIQLQYALDLMTNSGRCAMCGMIGGYNDSNHMPGPSNLSLIFQKTLRLQGFLVSHHFHRFPEARALLAGLYGKGALHVNETVVQGISQAPQAFLSLFSGKKMGKALVELA